MNRKLIKATLLIMFLMLSFLPACRTSASEKKQAVVPSASSSLNETGKSAQNISITESENWKLQEKIAAGPQLLAISVANWQIAYGANPRSLEEMMDGFILFWPENPLSNKAVTIIGRMPDPANLNDVGKVYYERTDDYIASIHFLNIDLEKSTDSARVWLVQKIDVDPRIAGFNPDGSRKQPSELKALSSKEKILIGTKFNLTQSVRYLMIVSLRKRGTLSPVFSDVLLDNGFYITDSGLSNLKKMVHVGKLTFDFGDNGNTTDFYYDWINIDLKKSTFTQERKCLQLNGFVKGYEVLYSVKTISDGKEIECPPPGPGAKSIFKSSDLDSYVFPATLIISKDKVI